MVNTVNKKFNFGFLNDAQDETDLKSNEGTEVKALDADKLALGTLELSDYITGSEAAKTYGVAPSVVNVAGTDFTIEATVSGGNKNVVSWTDDAGTLRGFGGSTNPPDNTNAKYPPVPVITIQNSVEFTTSSGQISARLVPDITYIGFDHQVITIVVSTDTAPTGGTVTYSASTTVGSVYSSGSPVVKPNWARVNILNNVGYSIDIMFADGVDHSGQTYTIDLDITALPDGEYTYANLTHFTQKAQNETEVRSPLGPGTAVEIRNFDATGARVACETPGLLISSVSDGKREYYRRSVDAPDFVRVIDDASVMTPSDQDPAYSVDTQRIFQLNPVVTARANLDDEGELSDAIGNDVGVANEDYQFYRIFSFDEVLWRVPMNRKDMILFGFGDILDTTRHNAFTFDGDFVDAIELRDPTTVGGSLTKAIFTTNGIYNITGSGTENDPYKSVRIITDIVVEDQSVVNVNGVIMFTSKSTDGGYDTGPYGQKIYEYDLQKVIEVSGRIKNSAFISSTAGVEYSQIRGGDKYLVKKTGVDGAVLYHRDVKGWIEIPVTEEAAGTWSWQSKQFTPDVFDRFKLAGARKFKIDMIGDITVTMTVEGPIAAGAQVTTYTLSTVVRTEIIRRLPAIKGRKWQIKIESAAGTDKVYDFYLVV